jgi:hypothetical protein
MSRYLEHHDGSSSSPAIATEDQHCDRAVLQAALNHATGEEVMPTYVAKFTCRKVGAIGIHDSHSIMVDFESTSGPVGQRGEAFDALLESGAYDRFEHFFLKSIGLAKRNREGLTFCEWCLAAASPQSALMHSEWLNGVDPGEYRR